MWGGSKNNDKEKPRIRGTREQQLADAGVLEGLMNAVRNKLQTSETIREMSQSGSYTTNPAYASERNVLMTLNNLGLAEGFIATMVTFITLRRGPAIIVRHIMKRQAAASSPSSTTSSYRLDTPNPFEKAETMTSVGGGVRKDRPFTYLLKFMRFGLDAFASLLVGASVSLYLTDQEEIFAQLSTVPLVEGRSVVADEFCSEIIKEFEKKPPEYWMETKSIPLQYVRTFVKNCHLRQGYERKLRKDYGMQPNEAVTIPAPGVDTSYSMEENPYGSNSKFVDSDFNTDANTMSNDDEDFFDAFGTSGSSDKMLDDDEWARRLVTDQEDDPNNQKD